MPLKSHRRAAPRIVGAAASQREIERRETLAVAASATDLLRIGKSATAVLEHDHGIDMRDFTILRLITEGCCYPSHLAATIGLPRNLITRAIASLTAKGYLVRSLDSSDTRRTHLTLTPKGEALFRRATESFMQWMVPRLKKVSEADKRGFFRTMAMVTAE